MMAASSRQRGAGKRVLRASMAIARGLGLVPVLKRTLVPLLQEELEQVAGEKMTPSAREVMEVRSRIASHSGTIIVGPWLSEVGFEVLYWIPFLQWLFEGTENPRATVVVVSRGGAQPWYGGLADEYVDVFDHFSPEEFRAGNAARIEDTGAQKHTEISDFDRRIFDAVTSARGDGDPLIVHPSIMYKLFRPYWTRRSSTELVERYTRYRPYETLGLDATLSERLPDDYIAAKFYFSESFPDTPENRRLIERIVRSISAHKPVVMLDTGLALDDHSDFRSAALFSLSDLMEPRTNLALQTAVVANASAFLGTYGGFSYLAPFYGVPSLALYSREDKFLPVHLDIAYRASRALKFGSFDKVMLRGNGPRHVVRGRPSFAALSVTDLELMAVACSGLEHDADRSG